MECRSAYESTSCGLSRQSNILSISTSDCFISETLLRAFVSFCSIFVFNRRFSSSSRFRVQLSKLFINLVSDDDLHKPGAIYKLIIRYIRQKHPNIVHVIDDVNCSCFVMVIFENFLGWECGWSTDLVDNFLLFTCRWSSIGIECCQTMPVNIDFNGNMNHNHGFFFSLTTAVEWLTNYMKNNTQSIDPTIRLKIQDVYEREHRTNPFKR